MTWKFRRRDVRRLARSLRFRLMVSYALLFLIMLVGTAVVFRARLASELTTSAENTLNEQWAAIKGSYLRIDPNPDLDFKYAANWYYDAADPDETTQALNLKKVLLVADENGNPIPEAIPDSDAHPPSVSTTYDDLGRESPAEIRAYVAMARKRAKAPLLWSERRTSKGEPFWIRSGLIWDERHRVPFYISIGVSLAKNEKILRDYTWAAFVVVIPLALILASLLGWIMAGRTLTPLRDVAQAAQRVSGSNLSLRIPTREAGDELDYLILTFNRMTERLQSSFQQMKQFSTDVSHELRTPITAIRGQLEVALFTAKTTDQYREAMFNALQDIDRLSQIVRALLLLSQAESGQLALQKTRLDLGDLIGDLVEQFQIPAEAAGVRLTCETSPGCFAAVDRVQIERLITNLFSNAFKFTPEGGQVRVAVRPSGERVEIVVEDSGCGIPHEHLPHIFDRFYRVTGSGTAPTPEQGLGLGLSFVAWIAKAHGGTVEVDSTPGEGTRFTVRLPVEPEVPGGLDLAEQAAAS
jgi:heavy metal sensor kinase